MEERVVIPCQSIRLEGKLAVSDIDKGSVLISHPHPLYGGNMDNPVVQKIQKAFYQAGFNTLCFNFRGTGSSTGMFDEGKGEQEDVKFCLAFLRERFGHPPILSGYSFGAWVNAQVVSSGEEVADHIMVSPPVAFISFETISYLPSTSLIVAGGADDLAPPGQIRSLMDRCNPGVRLEIIENADHFFSQSLPSLFELLLDQIS